MTTLRGLDRRRKTAIGLAISMLLGMLLVFQMPASASHGSTCLDVDHENNTASETDTNPVGSLHTVTATLHTIPPVGGVPGTACSDYPVAGMNNDAIIHFDVDGPGDPKVTEDNPPDGECRVNMGTCKFTYRGPNTAGTDFITGYPSDAARDTNETVDEGETSDPDPESDEPDATDMVQKNWVGGPAATLDCEPETDTNAVGDPHTITCTSRDQFGNLSGNPGTIRAEATGANDPDDTDSPQSPDFLCEPTGKTGECSFTHGPGAATNEPGTTTYRAWVDDNNTATDPPGSNYDTTETRSGDATNTNKTDVVEKNWLASPLNCNPEDDVNPTGTTHTITCSFRDANGTLEAGQRIHGEAVGANDPDATDGNSPTSPDFVCTTRSDNANTAEDEKGSCEIKHGPGGTGTTNDAGTTTYRFWVDDDNNAGTFDGDANEGVDESTQPGAAEGDRTDVVQKRWTASRLDCTPETDINPAGTAHAISCQAASDGAPTTGIAGVNIDVEATGANDPDNSNSPSTPDFTCTTSGSPSRCTIVHGGSGPGAVGTTTNGGTTTYRAWIDIDNNNATMTDHDTVDMNESQVESTDVDEPDNTDVVSKTWIASRLDCNPESDTNPAQSAHTITCTATDQSGAPQTSVNIDVEATGANDPDAAESFTSPDFSCTTGVSGSCTFIHGPGGRGTTAEFGRTIYRAWIDADGSDATTEADPTEGRNEGSTSSATPTPTPTPTTSASPSSGSSSQVVTAQQSATPTPTPTNSGSPSPTPSQSGSPGPTPTPSGTPGPTGPGTRVEPDDTDVVEKNWSAVPTTLQITPETDSAPVGSCNAFTVTATDAQGQPVRFVVVDIEQRHERSDNQTANDEPTVSFCTPAQSDGSNPSAVDDTRGDLGTGTDGSLGGETDKSTDAEGKITIGIRVARSAGSNGTGNVLVTAFYENEDNDDPDPADPQDSATKTWTPSQARTIDCEPETASNKVNTEHVVTCTARDGSGDPVQGEGVTFSEEGPGSFVGPTSANTNSQGQASATVTSSEAGTETITGTLSVATAENTEECDRPAGDPSGAPAGSCSDSVQKTWTPGRRVTSGPCKNFTEGSRTDRTNGGKVIVGTPGSDVLSGTNRKDIICGLGGRDAISGRGGADLISGGGGADTVQGGSGDDRVSGNDGNDELNGGDGDDRLNGGPGDDVLRGGAGDDALKGSGGNDALRGNGGKDTLFGNGGDDSLKGGAGADTLDGGDGRDRCAAGGDQLTDCEV